MPEEIQTTVKVPVMEIIASLRKKHELPSKLTGVRLEGNNIVLNFIGGGQESLEILKISEPTRRKEQADKEEVLNIEPMGNEEPMNDEPADNEEERERKRFWKK